MRRTIAPTVVAVTLLMGLALPAGAHHYPGHDAQGPPCSDIIGGSPTFSGLRAKVRMEFADATCSEYTYTFFVTPTVPAGPTKSLSLPGDGSSLKTLEFTIAVEATKVCVWAETTKPNGGLSDRSPNEAGSCDPLDADPLEPPGKSMG